MSSSVSFSSSLPSIGRPAFAALGHKSDSRSPFSEKKKLSLRNIPGDDGHPLVGPLRDRFDYFYYQGREEFLRSRVRRHGSTVLRLNVPPGPPISGEPRVVALLDGESFSILFDSSKVEKRDLFTGTYAPSLELTGGYRVLSYLDPSEPSHALLKRFLSHFLGSCRRSLVPEFRRSYGSLFDVLETDLARKGKAEFGPHNEQALFGFLSRGLLGKDPVDSGMGSDGPKLINKWVFFQLAPLLSLGIPPFLEDPLLHWFRLPPSLLQRDYQRLYDFFHRAAAPALNEAERMGISRAEACHNLLFAVCFNAFGGLKIFFPILLKWVSRAGTGIHTRLAMEIRMAVRSHGGEVSFRVMEEMPLMRSVVYEAFRIEPPVPLQFGRAKRDLLVQSHHAAYDVRRGEILFGYQPMATKDPMIFDRAEEFIGERFLGEGGPALLRRVLWSNGPETEVPTPDNKQCPGKDLVMIASRLLLVVLFLRYDSFDIETKAAPLGTAVTLTSLKKATF